MALGTPTYRDFAPSSAPKKSRQTAPTTGTTSPPVSTTIPPKPIPTPSPSPVPTGTTPSGPTPNQPRGPMGPPAPAPTPVTTSGGRVLGGQVPMIPYQENKLITPSEWAQAYPNSPYPMDHVTPGPDMIQAQYDQQTADRMEQSAKASEFNQNILSQYDAWSDSQMDALNTQYGLGVANAGALMGLNKQILGQGQNVDLALLRERQYRDVTLPQQQVAGQKQDLAGYFDILNARKGIRRDQFVTDRDYYNALNASLGQSRGLAYDQFTSNDAYLAGQGQDLQAQYGFNTAENQLALRGATLQRDTSQRAAVSDAAGRGAFGSPGFRDNVEDIMSQFGLNRDEANLALKQANQQVDERGRAITNERSNLGFGYQGQVIGFDKEATGLTRNAATNYNSYRDDLQGFAKQDLDLRSQGRELESTTKALASLGREYGVKEQDIKQQFQNATTRLNLDYRSTMDQLGQMLESGNNQLIQQAMQFMTQLMAFQ